MSSQESEEKLLDLSRSILHNASIHSLPAGYTFAQHFHSSMELYRILSGKCYMTIASENLCCGEGDFVLILPNIVHSLSLDDSSDCIFEQAHFDHILFKNIILDDNGICPVTLMHALVFSSNLYYHFSSDADLDAYFDRLISLHKSADAKYRTANINISLIHMMLHILELSASLQNAKETRKPNHFVTYVLDYISEHYMEKIRQEDLAAQLKISVRYLGRLFKDYIGLPISTYINMFRINRSIVLMKDEKLTLTDIALSVGFSNSQYYSKVFMDVMNESPSHYRKHLSD